MAATKFMESGSDATQGLEFYTATSGTVASATDQAHDGPRSIKCSTGAGPTLANCYKAGILADTGRRISLWFRFDTAFAATAGIFSTPQSDGVTQVIVVQMTSSRTLILSPTGATSASGSTVLATNTWYRLALSYYITNTTTYTAKLYIHDSNNILLETLTANAGTLSLTTTNALSIRVGAPAGANRNVWFDSIFVDDGASSASQPDTGDIRVTAKRPFANGTTNGFTGTGAGSGYGSGNAVYVNEQPLNVATYVSVVAAGVTTEEYNVEDRATGDVDLTGNAIVDLCGWLYAKAAMAETGSMVLNGATSNISLTSTTTMFQAYAGATSYPAGTGTDIGIVTTALATTVTLYEAGILVAYTPFKAFWGAGASQLLSGGYGA